MCQFSMNIVMTVSWFFGEGGLESPVDVNIYWYQYNVSRKSIPVFILPLVYYSSSLSALIHSIKVLFVLVDDEFGFEQRIGVLFP